MLFFIPAWYAQNEWRENEQVWYSKRMQTEMDDTVKQIQLFHRTMQYPYQILLLSYAPNFRHFLHRQGVFNAPYWSCFDAISCIKTKQTAVLSFYDFEWPEHIEFIYSYFAVIAKLHGKKYGQVEFGEDGNPIRVDFFRNDQLVRRDHYDDRGFIGSTVVYENGQMLHESYLDPHGTWKIRHFADGHVEVNPESAYYYLEHESVKIGVPYMRTVYESLDAVISEVTENYISLIAKKHIFCVAMHDRHTAVLAPLLADRRTILSFWTGRSYNSDRAAAFRMMEQANCLIADSQATRHQLTVDMGSMQKRILEITPYDSRMDFGISLQQHTQKVLIPVDHVPDALFADIITQTARYMEKNPHACVHLFTRNALYDRQDLILAKTQAVLEAIGSEPAWARKPSPRKPAPTLEEEEETIPIRYYVEQCVEELSVSKCVRVQRLLVDLAPEPDLFLQIVCLSMGIPQILRKETRYMTAGKNGRINTRVENLGDDMAFYLESIANWNQAMISSYELGAAYTSKELARRWKEVISEIGKDSNSTAGKD